VPRPASRRDVLKYTLALGLGLGFAVLCGHGVASAEPGGESASAASQSDQHPARAARTGRGAPAADRPQPSAAGTQAGSQRQRPAADIDTDAPVFEESAPTVAVELPPMPVSEGQSFAVRPDAVADRAADYVAAGGDASDAPRFFFGDLAVHSLDTLATQRPSREQVGTQLGNLAVSGYFGGIWLRDNLRDAPAPAAAPAVMTGALSVSAIGIRLFDALAAGLVGLATSSSPAVATTAARASVPVLLTLYGYNRGYLEFLLENPPAGVDSLRDTLSCKGFLGCTSTAAPLEIATRYDAALANLDSPPSPAWQEMAAWTSGLQNFTGAGRFVWQMIAQAGAFSPASYGALVDLSSAYLMVSKAAVLAGMQGYADGDADLAASALLLQAGLWMWSGAYFSGLASDAPRGTIPSIAAA
jgi:hypothetical protein